MPNDAPSAPALDYINESLRPLAQPIADFALDPKNARKHDAKNMAATVESLKLTGQAKCIVVWDQTPEQGGGKIIIAGNGTVEAAKRLGWTHIAANVRGFDSEAAAVAYGLADNRTAELASWDYEELVGRFGDLKADGWEIGNLGWEDYELEPLLNAEFKPVAPDDTDASTDGEANTPGAVVATEVGGRNGEKHWKVLLTTEQKEALDGLLGDGWSGEDLVAAARGKAADA